MQGLVKIGPRGGGGFAPGIFRTDQSAPGGHFPFRLGGQAVSVGVPLDVVVGQVDLTGPID